MANEKTLIAIPIAVSGVIDMPLVSQWAARLTVGFSRQADLQRAFLFRTTPNDETHFKIEPR
jgi:hypothetical protein